MGREWFALQLASSPFHSRCPLVPCWPLVDHDGRGVMFPTVTTLTPSQRQQLERHCCRRLGPSSIGIGRQQETFKIGSVLVNLTSSSERLRRLPVASTVPAAGKLSVLRDLNNGTSMLWKLLGRVAQHQDLHACALLPVFSVMVWVWFGDAVQGEGFDVRWRGHRSCRGAWRSRFSPRRAQFCPHCCARHVHAWDALEPCALRHWAVCPLSRHQGHRRGHLHGAHRR